MENVIIIGSGPAGLTAAIYAARANLSPLLFAGEKWGGQLMLTSDIENFPGFVDALQGPQLMENMRKQAERFKTRIVDKDVIKVDLSMRPFTVWSNDEAYKTKSLIIATGAETRWLHIPGEQELIGKGVSSCAPCDAFFFKNMRVAVVGGGDSAMEEALYLAKFAKEVTIIHRRNEFRASKIMQDRVKAEPKISIIWDTVVERVNGEQKVTSLSLKNVKTGKTSELPVEGMFVAIGHDPVTGVFKDQITLDDQQYITLQNHTETNVEGVFVAGDVHDRHYKQAVTAAGFGCMAAMDAERWLASLPIETHKS